MKRKKTSHIHRDTDFKKVDQSLLTWNSIEYYLAYQNLIFVVYISKVLLKYLNLLGVFVVLRLYKNFLKLRYLTVSKTDEYHVDYLIHIDQDELDEMYVMYLYQIELEFIFNSNNI